LILFFFLLGFFFNFSLDLDFCFWTTIIDIFCFLPAGIFICEHILYKKFYSV
jgi:hypothetical protein